MDSSISQKYYLYEYSTTKFVFKILKVEKEWNTCEIVFRINYKKNPGDSDIFRLFHDIHRLCYKQISIPEYLTLKLKGN